MRLLAVALISLAAFASSASAKGVAETDVAIDGGLAPLKGTLCMPEGTASVPVVLILAGSGPTDRNGNSPYGLSTDAYKLIAQALAENGIGSLRVDKRGIAASTAAATKEQDLRLETYVDDAAAWSAFLKRQPRAGRAFILGHSEGALVGSVAAQRGGIAGFVSIAGAGLRAGEIIRRQLAAQALPAPLRDEAFRAIAELEAGRLVPSVSKELAALFRPSVQPYLISWFKYDPAAEIAKLKMPVLIVQGTTDIQVSVEDAKTLAAAKPDARMLIIEGMNHVLRAAPADRAANAATYAQPTLPLKPELVPALVAFVKP